MFKSKILFFAVVMATTACGGGSGGNKSNEDLPSSSSVSSVAVSSVEASSASSALSSSSNSSLSSSSSSSLSSANSVTDYFLKINVTAAGQENWQPQVAQTLTKGIVAGQHYVMSYKVKASTNKHIGVMINLGSDSTPQYKVYPADPNSFIDVTTDWQTHSVDIIPTETDASVDLTLNLGAQGTYQVWFDDISFKKSDGTEEQIVNGSMVKASDWKYLTYGGTGVATVAVVDNLGNVVAEAGPTLHDYPVTKRSPLFLPSGTKNLLIMGQDMVALGNITDGATTYSNGYFDDADLKSLPLGVTTYLEVTDSQGLTTTFHNNGEEKNAELILNNSAFGNNLRMLAIGYYLGNDYTTLLNGGDDTNLQTLADWIKAKNVPVFLRIGYEFNADWTGHPANKIQFINSFRYIVSKLESFGVKNCSFVWQSDGFGTTQSLADMYPGDDYVDWIAYSHFYPIAGVAEVKFSQDHNKPLMVAESAPLGYNLAKSGDADGQTAWNNWFTPLFNKFNSTSNLRALAYINDNWPAKAMWATNSTFNTSDTRIQMSPYVKTQWVLEMNSGRWYQRSELATAIGWPLP